MAYLTAEEYSKLGFDEVEDFEKLEQRAELAIDLFTDNFYDTVDFETDNEKRKKAVQLAVAFQVCYLDTAAIMTADDKMLASNISVGRTSVGFQNGSNSAQIANQYNLSLDALNWLKSAGFGQIRGVLYDR